MTTKTKARRRVLGRFEVMCLWLSYQRYSFVLAGSAVLLPVGLMWLLPGYWFLWGLPALLVSSKFVFYAVMVYRRWPRKLRATMVATRRIASGGFEPDSVLPFCGDPCFRLVASEILRRAGLGLAERVRIIRRLAVEKRNQPEYVVLVDRTNGVTVRVEGTQITRTI